MILISWNSTFFYPDPLFFFLNLPYLSTTPAPVPFKPGTNRVANEPSGEDSGQGGVPPCSSFSAFLLISFDYSKRKRLGKLASLRPVSLPFLVLYAKNAPD
jgi:hypothetical protein